MSEAAGDLAAGDASDFSLASADPAEEPLPSALYGGLMWSVVDSRATPSPGLLEAALVEVDLSVANTLNETELRVPDSMLGLVALDGSAGTKGRFVDAGPRLSVEPGESFEVTIRFDVGFADEPDPADLGLRIGEINRIPALIPLVGEPEVVAYPVMAAVETSPVVLPDPDDTSRQIVIEPQAAAIDINAGAYRAARGERLAIVRVVVQRTSGDDTSGFLADDYWALETGGKSISPILATRTDQPAPNADEVTLLFAFPEGDEDDLMLRARANAGGGEQQATFAIVVPH